MKFFILFVWVLSFNVFSESSEFHFYKGDLKSLEKKAKKLKKPILYDFYTDWCPPCKVMDDTVLKEEKVIQFFNSKYLCKKIDGDSEIAKELMQKYGIAGFPSYVFLSPDGKRFERISGAVNSKQFLYSARVALDPGQSLDSLRRKFIENPGSRKHLDNLLDVLEEQDISEIGGILDYYHMRKKKISLRELWLDIRLQSPLNSTRVVQLARKHIPKIKKIFPKENVELHLQKIAMISMIHAMKNVDENAFLEARSDYGESKSKEEKQSLDILQLDFYGRLDLEKFRKYASSLAEGDYQDDWEVLMVIAEQFKEKIQRKDDLVEGLKYIDQSIKIQENATNQDTKALILQEMGKVDEAKTLALRVKKLRDEDPGRYQDVYLGSLDLLK